jgi:hypothetical protein
MAGGKNFGRVNVSITASTGGLTAGLGRASKQLRGFGAQAQGLNGMLTRSLAGFVGLGRGATMAAVGVRVLSTAIKTLLLPVAAITSLVGIFTAIGRTARDLDAAGKASQRLGMSMETFQALSQVANEAGSSMAQMSTLLTFMNRNLGGLTAGSASAQKAFAGIGLTLADLQNLSPERQFELISQRIMALPTVAERTAAAIAIFGRAGAQAMGLISSVASGAVSEVKTLQKQLGINLTREQEVGIQRMNDAIGRMSMVFQGFINQFLAELAPAITTVANLFVKFFAENTQGWTLAKSLAEGFALRLRLVVGAVTAITGAFQVLSSFVGRFIQGAIKAFEGVTWAIQKVIGTMAAAAEALPGFDVGLASSLRSAERTMAGMSTAAGDEAAIWGQAAADNFATGVENMRNPYAAFDREFASVRDQMEQAGAAAGGAAGETAGQAIGSAIRASGKALKAMVVGTGEGESFANAIARGADPRREGDAAKATANNTERTADAVEDLADGLAGLGGGLGLATIAV